MRVDADFVDVLQRLALAYAPTHQVSSVGVVGNAPLRPDAARAAAVDRCDVVVRVNGFALDTISGPPTVGSRTHLVVFNRGLRASPWFFDRYRDRLYVLLEPGRLHWEPESWPHWWPEDLGYLVASNEAVTIPLSEAMGLDSRRHASWATTGTVAAWLARLAFPGAALTLTGLSFVDEPDQQSWEHHWGEPSPVGPEHLIVAESELIRSWIDAGQATFLR